MSEYTIDVNGKRYELNEDFREAIEERARREYADNHRFSCWWQVKDGNPVLTIETAGKTVPWEDLDQLEMEIPDVSSDDDDEYKIVSDNGMAEVKPGDEDKPRDIDFGRNHFALTPHRFDEMPTPGGDDPDKIPEEPEEIDDEMLVAWIPSHPDVDEIWDTGTAITMCDSWVEWDIQKKAEQPRPRKEKRNSHDAFESLCQIYDCEVVAEAEPSNDIPKNTAGQVERKGERSFEDGKYGGNNWSV